MLHEKVIYTGRTDKANQGGIKHRKREQKVITQYADPENDRCVVRLFKTYLALIPANGPFYRRPLQQRENVGPRFSSTPLGVNTMKTLMKSMFETAGTLQPYLLNISITIRI